MKNYHLMIAICAFAIHCAGDQDDWKKADRIIPMDEYSEGDAREWEDIKKEHIPVVRKSIDQGKSALLIEVPLLQITTSHYIEKFGVMTLDGQVLESVTIERNSSPLGYAYIPWDKINHHRRLKAFAKCNLHDLWVHEFELFDLE